MQDKTIYVADGCITFIEALINQHHADPIRVFQRVADLCQQRANQIAASDPERNR